MSTRSLALLATAFLWAPAMVSAADAAGSTPAPSPDRAAVARGQAAVDAGKYEEAERDFAEGLRIAPGKPDYLARLGNALRAEDKLDAAIKSLDAAIAGDPKQAWFYVARARTYQDKGDEAKARADFDAAIALDPKNESALYYRSVFLYDNNDDQGAMADITSALTLSPQDADAIEQRGDIFSSMKRYDEANADFAATLKLDPRNY